MCVCHTKQGIKAAPAQRLVGYKGSTEAGSAPKTYVFDLAAPYLGCGY